MRKHILHIANNYFGTKVYSNLFKSLEENGYKNTIIVPLPEGVLLENSLIPNNVKIIYIPVASLALSRFFPWIRANIVFRHLIENNLLDDIDYVHAHTVHSNGWIGYKVSKHCGCPLIISIRQVDVNDAIPINIHLRSYYKEIINHARLTAPNPTFVKKINKWFPNTNVKVIPNFIDEKWWKFTQLNNKNHSNNLLKILTITEIAPVKNIEILLETGVSMKNAGYNIEIDVVGKSINSKHLNYEKKIKQKYDHDWINFHGEVKNFSTLKKLMHKNHIFYMNSYKETFGLVYIEALTQNLPIIYSRDQGISGYFKEGEVGYSVTSNDIQSSIKSIEKIIKNYKRIRKNIKKNVRQFKKNETLKKWLSIYER